MRTYNNPFFKKLEFAEDGQLAASYGGIAVKSIWFWIVTILGIGTFYYLPIEIIGAPILIAGLVTMMICSFAVYFFPSTTPVTGTLYSLMQGYVLGYACTEYAKEYEGIVWIALGLTMLVSISMLVLYLTNIIKVGHRFRTIIFTLFMASFLGSGIVLISSFFTPVLRDLVMGNGIVGIVISIALMIIASLNLVVQFDNVAQTVRLHMIKKYEWLAAYGLYMAVVLLFIRILELVAKLMDKKDRD